MPLFDQVFLQRQIVLYDAIVHHGEIARAVRMRMGVAVRRASMRRPARMADADLPLRLIALDDPLELGETAHAFFHTNLVFIQNGNARRIITAILKLRQPFDEKRRRLALADITHDSTHRQKPPWKYSGKPFPPHIRFLPGLMHWLVPTVTNGLSSFLRPTRPRGIR